MVKVTTEARMLIAAYLAKMSVSYTSIIKDDIVCRLSPDTVTDVANSIARRRGMRVTACRVPEGIQISTVQREARLDLRLDTLVPGECRRISATERQHVNIRVRASAIAKHNGWRVTVNKIDANTVEVTRIAPVEPVSAELRQAFEAKVMTLQPGGELNLTMKKLTKVQARSIVANLAAEHKISLSAEDTEAGVRVVRGPDPVKASPGRPKGSGRWNFYTLKADGESMDVAVAPADLQKLRQAASVFSTREGIRLSVQAGDQPGVACVTRLGAAQRSFHLDPAGQVARERWSQLPFDQLKLVGQWFFVWLSEYGFRPYLQSTCRYHGDRLDMKLSVRLHDREAQMPDRGYCVIRVE